MQLRFLRACVNFPLNFASPDQFEGESGVGRQPLDQSVAKEVAGVRKPPDVAVLSTSKREAAAAWPSILPVEP